MILGNFYERLNSKVVLIIGGKTWPKDRRWIIAVSIISLLAVAAYGVEWAAESQVPGGSSRCGLLYGIAGGALIIAEIPSRHSPPRPIRPKQSQRLENLIFSHTAGLQSGVYRRRCCGPSRKMIKDELFD